MWWGFHRSFEQENRTDFFLVSGFLLVGITAVSLVQIPPMMLSGNFFHLEGLLTRHHTFLDMRTIPRALSPCHVKLMKIFHHMHPSILSSLGCKASIFQLLHLSRPGGSQYCASYWSLNVWMNSLNFLKCYLGTDQSWNITSHSCCSDFLQLIYFFFYLGFSFTTIHESQDCRGRGTAYL